ncbi:ABC transporter substrate-binding protein [Gordoniibacillus kamchatkensis]|nr:sugar ABC transporter substrate-binding protein [Paenibacillus sp. VKM B-2647]
MKRKWVMSGTAVMLMLSVVLGCAKGAGTDKPNEQTSKPASNSAAVDNKDNKKPFEGVTLKAALVGGGSYEKLYESIPKFEQETGAKVQITYKGNFFDLDKKLKIDFASKSDDYDVISNHSSFYSQYVDSLEPLNNLFSADDMKDFTPMILNGGKRDNNLYMIPRLADISVYFYRTDLYNDESNKTKFKQDYGYDLAPPTTLDQFKDQAIFFTKNGKGINGTQFAGKEEALTGRFYELVNAYGGDFFDKDKKVILNQEAGIKAATMLQDLYKAGAMPKGMVNFLWDEVAKNFGNGNVAVYSEWPGWYTWMDDPASTKVAGKFDVVRAPAGPSGVHPGWSGAHGFSVTKSSKNKPAAAALIKFLTSADNMYADSKLGNMPTRQSVWDKVLSDAKASGDARKINFYNVLNTALKEDFRTPPLIKEWIPLSNILYPYLQKIILGSTTPKQGLDDAAKDIEKMMKQSGN